MSEIGNDRKRFRFDNATQIGYIEEVLINILARLPVKTVVACKIVAKHWLKLISEPQFPVLQLTWSRRKLKYIICPYPEDTDIITHLSLDGGNGKISQTLPLSGFENICSPEMFCFMNGLICSVDEDDDLNEVNVRIFNPITQDTLLLPRGSPSLIVPSVGIAFDPKSNEFKAFRFFSEPSEDEDVKYKCEVYTSRSTAWRRISEDVERPDHNPFHPFPPYYASVAGSLYWFVWSEDDPGTPLRILSVDMNDNFTEIELPTLLHQWSFLIEFEGCLSVVLMDYPDSYTASQHEDPRPYLEVYKFKNHKWSLRAKAEMELMDIHSFNSVAARDNEIFLIIRLADDSFCYLIFDMAENSFRTLALSDSFEGYSPVAFPFAESLLKYFWNFVDYVTDLQMEMRWKPFLN
ncbi:F-box protein [Sesamum angolense]|uniref:F-box protein n=1 Tax=Sesamum angolense TaxID=2727404 RepID=A0AAE2BTY7_9LAMI|nr:F-box protein [Sesamum angolense]